MTVLKQYDSGSSTWVPVVFGDQGPAGPTSVWYSVPGTLTVAAGAMRIPFPRAATVTNVAVMVSTAPTGASVIVDVNKNGTTMFTTQANRPTIAASGTADNTSVPDVTSISANDYITVDVDQIGSTVAGANLSVRVDFTEP